MALTDAQKIILHLCMQAEKRGRDDAWITRESMSDGRTVPQHAGIKLVWAALTLPPGVLEWSECGKSFRLTDDALATINARRANRLKQKV